MVGLAGILCPLDFQRTSSGLPMDRDRNNSYFAKCSVHRTSTGLPLDTEWTSKQKRCKTVLSVQSAILINKSEKRQYIQWIFNNSIARFETCEVEFIHILLTQLHHCHYHFHFSASLYLHFWLDRQ
jgi:hypothetical protein